MVKVYQSVRGVVQGTLQRRKPEPKVPAPVNGNERNLTDTLDEFERMFVDGIGRLKAAISDHQSMVVTEAQHAEQVIETLKANVTALEAKLEQAEDTAGRRATASRQMEDSLRAEIRDLQTLLNEKEEDLQSRDAEVTNLKAKMDVLVEQATNLEVAIQQGKEKAANEAQHAGEVIETLKANVTALEAKLEQAEDTAGRRATASRQMEDSLRAEIRDLQTLLNEKEEDLQSRDAEVTNLKAKMDVLVEQATNLEVAIQQGKEKAANEAQHAGEVVETLKANITALEAKLAEAEDTARRKDRARQTMEEGLGAEIRDLQSLVKKKEEALEIRESEVNDLKSKIDGLVLQVTYLELAIQQAKGQAATDAQHAEQIIEDLKARVTMLEAEQIVGGKDGSIKGLDQEPVSLKAASKPRKNVTKERSSSSSEAEALANIQTQDSGMIAAGGQLKSAQETSAIPQFQAPTVNPVATDPARQIVSQDAFDRMITEFSERTNVIGRIASLIVRDHVKALGESMQKFPQRRLTELVESLSKEIADDKLKADFRRRFAN